MEAAAVYLLIAAAALGAVVYFTVMGVARIVSPKLGAVAGGYRARPSTRRNYAQRR